MNGDEIFATKFDEIVFGEMNFDEMMDEEMIRRNPSRAPAIYINFFCLEF